MSVCSAVDDAIMHVRNQIATDLFADIANLRVWIAKDAESVG
jgi:flagellar biosynthesis regulator FlaF